jgi:hypothetical protein
VPEQPAGARTESPVEPDRTRRSGHRADPVAGRTWGSLLQAGALSAPSPPSSRQATIAGEAKARPTQEGGDSMGSARYSRSRCVIGCGKGLVLDRRLFSLTRMTGWMVEIHADRPLRRCSPPTPRPADCESARPACRRQLNTSDVGRGPSPKDAPAWAWPLTDPAAGSKAAGLSWLHAGRLTWSAYTHGDLNMRT